jgi:3-oxoacyl-(acyl-carrier-protein) synthase
MAAARELRKNLAANDDGETLLIDSQSGVRRFDQPELTAWSDWSGPRWSPKLVLGECMGAAGALQVVSAVEALKSGDFRQVAVSSVGANQQAAGVLLGA